MVAVGRYVFADLFRSGRWLPPVAIYFVLLAVLGVGDPKTLLGSAALTAGLLYPVGVWLTIAVVSCEDPTQSSVTYAAGRGIIRVRLAKLLLAYVLTECLAVLAVVDLASGVPHVTDAAVAEALVAHLLAGLLGVALGGVCSPPLVRRTAQQFLFAALVVLISLLPLRFAPMWRLIKVLGVADPTQLPLRLSVCAAVFLSLAAATTAAELFATRART